MKQHNVKGNQLNNTMFHCTLRENLNNILKAGLQPCKPPLISNAIEGVYLSSKPFDWMHTATEETTKAGAMVEVNIEGLVLIQDENLKASDSCFVCRDCISIDRFVGIVVSTDEKPYQFEPIDFKTLEMKFDWGACEDEEIFLDWIDSLFPEFDKKMEEVKNEEAL